ncbi:MAG: hypothetical protein HGA85_06820 [Nanoarchaeota archaeon]|nr:hypothetical protein [Nanoarchaeota archaeon]
MILLKMLASLTRKGKGIFKVLCMIDYFFRFFTRSILIHLLFSWLKLPSFVVILGFLLGAIIDIQDFMAEMGIRKV